MQSETLLKSILTVAMIGEKSAEQIIIDRDLRGTAKHKMKMIASRFVGIQKELTMSISPELAAIIRDEVIENWNSFSFLNIIDSVMKMNDEQREIVDEFATQLLNGYVKLG